MAAFEAIERLQKFDWLIQKLHSLRTSLQSEPGLTELQQLHALQLLQRNAGFNGSSLGESETEGEKMELCKLEGEEEEEEPIGGELETENKEEDEEAEVVEEEGSFNGDEPEENDEREEEDEERR